MNSIISSLINLSPSWFYSFSSFNSFNETCSSSKDRWKCYSFERMHSIY